MPAKRKTLKTKSNIDIIEKEEEVSEETTTTTTTETTETSESEDSTTDGKKRKQLKDADIRRKEGKDKETDDKDVEEVEKKTDAANENRRRVKVPRKKVDMKDFKFNWKCGNFIGVELDNIPEIMAQNYEFNSLNDAFKEGGVLSDIKHPIYLFMSAQPVETLTTNAEGKVSIDIVNVPYIVAIVCDIRPEAFDSVAVTSIQLGEEGIKSLKDCKLSWEPYKPNGLESESDSNLFVMQWSGRQANTKSMRPEDKSNYSLTVPYIALPQVIVDLGTIEERLANVKCVTFKYKSTTVRVPKVYEKGKRKPKTDEEVLVPKEIDIVWDKDVMVTSVDIPIIIEDNGLDESEYSNIVAAIKQAFDNDREKEQDKYNKEMAKINQFNDREKQNLRNIKYIKFYPEKEGVNIDKKMVPIINRFYGNAHEIFPKPTPSPLNYADTEERMKAGKEEIFTFNSDKSVPPTITGFQFNPSSVNSNAPNKFFSSTTQLSSNSTTNTVFTWPATTKTTVPDPDNNNYNSTATQPTGGFFFNPAAVQPTTTTANTNQWKCKACESFNPDSSARCSLCMCNR